MRIFRLIISIAISSFVIPATELYADSDRSSANGSNTDQAREYLPGEEVVTESGQKLKVWSTRGPVEVNKAPEPFEDSDDQIDVIVDTRDKQQRRDRRR